MLTGEPRFIDDEVRNTTLGTIFAVLAAIFCIVAMILTWILYYRERTRTFLWHAIFLIVAILFSFAAIGWAFSTGKTIKTGKHQNSILSLIVFIGSLFFAVYLFTEAFWFVFYRHVHFSYLIGLRTDDALWNHRMTSGSTFEDGWKSSRRMMWWVAFFSLAAGCCFAFLSYAARSVVWNRYQLTRIGLYIACLAAVIIGFIVVYWAEECYEYQKVVFNDYTKALISTLKVLAIISIVYAVINAVVNIIRTKLLYFILGILGIVLLVLLVCASSYQWRYVRESQLSRLDVSCIDALLPTHESNLADVCINGGKYLNAGQTCSKDFLVNRWEGNQPNEIRSLNPGCCELGKSYYNMPFMYLAYYTMVLCLLIAIIAVCDFYLADTSEYLGHTRDPITAIDYGLLALVFIALIAWILYFLIRKPNQIPNGTRAYAVSYEDPEVNRIQGFDLVPDRVLESVNPSVNNDGCLTYSTVTMANPTFSKTDPTCTTNCVHRIALLSKNSKIVLPADMQGSTIGALNSRLNFFPGCTRGTHDYEFFYGTLDQVKAALNRVRLCPVTLGTEPVVYLYQDQVPQSSISYSGLRSGETTTDSLNDADSIQCTNSFAESNTCEGKCTVQTKSPERGYKFQRMKGSLYYIDQGQKKTNIATNMLIETFAKGQELNTANSLFDTNGIFIIDNIPRYKDSDYVLQIRFTDPNQIFLQKSVDVLVPRDSGLSDELSAGVIRLVTKNGKVCAIGDANCINAQPLLTGQATFVTKDGKNTAGVDPLAGVTIQINKGFTRTGDTVRTLVSDQYGVAKITGLEYGSYTVTYSKAGYYPT